MTRREFLGRAGLGVLASGLGLGVGEAIVRLVRPPDPLVRMGQFSELVGAEHHLEAAEIFRADPELFWRLAPGLRLPDDAWPLFGVVSNGQGLRAAWDYARPKPAGTLRLLFVGDSVTFGYLAGHDETFVAFAEATLTARLPDLRVECLNAGVPGYTLFQGWRYLETRAAAWQPDLVVLNFGWNENASWDGRGDWEHYRVSRARRPPAPLDRSRLAQLAWQSFRGQAGRPRGTGSRPRILPHEFRDLLNRCRARVRDLGAELVVLLAAGRSNVEPTPLRDYLTPLQEEQLRFGRSIALGSGGAPALVDAVDVLQGVAGEQPASTVFFDRVHMTPLGNRLVGEAVASHVAPWLAERSRA